jgi:hypothetical protein
MSVDMYQRSVNTLGKEIASLEQRLYRLSCGCKLSPPQKKSMAVL